MTKTDHLINLIGIALFVGCYALPFGMAKLLVFAWSFNYIIKVYMYYERKYLWKL